VRTLRLLGSALCSVVWSCRAGAPAHSLALSLALSLARARALCLSLSLSVSDSTAPRAALVPCDSTARTGAQSNKPRGVERLPVALVFWYMPDSSDSKSATPFWHGSVCVCVCVCACACILYSCAPFWHGIIAIYITSVESN
jgi:hypothetical protein